MRGRAGVGAAFSPIFSGGLGDHLGNLIWVERDPSIISVQKLVCTPIITAITTVRARVIC